MRMRLPWQRGRGGGRPARIDETVLLSHAEQIRALNDMPLFLPLKEHVVDRVLPIIVLTSLALAALYAFCHWAVAARTNSMSSSSSSSSWLLAPSDKDDDAVDEPNETSQQQGAKRRQRTRRTTVHKLCYQLTNMSVNAFLGILGFYYQLRYVYPYRDMKISDTIVGHDHWAVLAAVQIGYQLWSIPVGIYHVNESPAMLLHHFAVIMVASMSAFLTGGFRYWTPFFYGIIEISSVPLAVMNMFKDRHDWVQQYPQLYTAIRLAFCATFLWVRVFMFVPRKVVYLRDHYLLWSSAYQDHSRPILYVVFMALVWASSVFLLGLQLHWGLLIVRGLLKLVVGGGKGKGGNGTNQEVQRQPTSSSASSASSAAAAANNGTTNGAIKQKTR